VIRSSDAEIEAFDTNYAKDKSNAYFDSHPIPAADATTFAVLDRGGFAKDRNHVYQLDRSISDDPAHFELLDGGLSKDSTQDARRIFYFTDPVIDADAVSFRALDGPYAGDTRRMYWMGKAIDGADPATFRVLNAAFECSADAARVLSAIRHRRRGSADFPAGPRCHELHRDVDFVRGVVKKSSAA
jgi:hypothetical protein